MQQQPQVGHRKKKNVLGGKPRRKGAVVHTKATFGGHECQKERVPLYKLQLLVYIGYEGCVWRKGQKEGALRACK